PARTRNAGRVYLRHRGAFALGRYGAVVVRGIVRIAVPGVKSLEGARVAGALLLPWSPQPPKPAPPMTPRVSRNATSRRRNSLTLIALGEVGRARPSEPQARSREGIASTPWPWTAPT